MKAFRDMVESDEWSKEDLINMIKEEDINEEDIMEITNLVMEMIEYSEFGDIDERMSQGAKKEAAKKRRKPAFKKATRLKAKCLAKHGDKIKSSEGAAVTKICGSDGKLKKGKTRKEKIMMAKTRKKNKNIITK